MSKRVFLIVLDSFGIGASPDAYKYGDTDSNTLATLAKSKYFFAPNLFNLGLFNIDGINIYPQNPSPKADFARLKELSQGKDTVSGHWEMAGIVSKRPFPTYPNGFDEEILQKLTKATGRNVLCNKPYSGTQVILDYGKQHMQTGDLIVYTSADSVMQIATHEDIVPVEQLYQICRTARQIMSGKDAVGRIIARPFVGEYPNFKRTSNRHDFALPPPNKTMLDCLKEGGFDTIGIGKINDIFCGQGLTESIKTVDNADGMSKIMQTAQRDFCGLCFANLVDFDSQFGHRNDIDGYAKAISAFDKWLGDFLPHLNKDDALIITADHGCDPATPSTDHSREYVPFLHYGLGAKGNDNLGTKNGFFFVAQTICALLGVPLDNLNSN